MPQFRNVVRIRQATHIKHQIGFRRNAVLESERSHLNGHGVRGIVQKDLPNLFFQLRSREIGRFNIIIRNALHAEQLLPFVGNGIVQTAPEPFVQRVLPAGFLIPLDDDFVLGFDIEDLHIQICLLLHLQQCPIGICEHIAGTQVCGNCQLLQVVF